MTHIASATVHSAPCNQPWLRLIADRTKDVEGRLSRGLWRNIRVGDQLRLYDPEDRNSVVTRTVVELVHAPDFKALYDRFGARLLPPGVDCSALKVAPEQYQRAPWTIYQCFYPSELVAAQGAVGVVLGD